MQVVDVDVDILALLFVPDCSIVWNIRGIYDTQDYLLGTLHCSICCLLWG